MILDIICLIIVLLAAVIGIFKGLFKMAARLVSLILAFITACCFAVSLSGFVYNSFVAPKVGEMIDAKIEECGAQETVETIYTTVTEIQVGIAKLQGGEIPEELQDSIDRAQSFGSQVSDTLYSLGIDTNAIGNTVAETGAKTIDAVKNSDAFKGIQAKYEELSEFIGNISPNIVQDFASNVSLPEMDKLLDKVETLNPIQAKDEKVLSQVSAALTDVIRVPVVGVLTPICFVVIYIVCLIVYCLILNLVANLLDKIKLIDKVQKIGGGIVGLLFGVGIASIVALIAQAAFPPSSEFFYVLDGSMSMNIAAQLKDLLTKSITELPLAETIGMTK